MFLAANLIPNDLRGHIQVFWNGRDITQRCRAADDERGLAWCLVRGPGGGWLCPPGSETPIVEVLTGLIEFRVTEDAVLAG